MNIRLPSCHSLKEKRSRLKPLLARLHREFNVSAAEMKANDNWQITVIECALVSNENSHTIRTLQEIPTWIQYNWPDIELIDEKIEII